jgi:hypothetical protein
MPGSLESGHRFQIIRSFALFEGIFLFEGIQECNPGFPFWFSQTGQYTPAPQSDAGVCAGPSEGRDPAQEFIGRMAGESEARAVIRAYRAPISWVGTWVASSPNSAAVVAAEYDHRFRAGPRISTRRKRASGRRRLSCGLAKSDVSATKAGANDIRRMDCRPLGKRWFSAGAKSQPVRTASSAHLGCAVLAGPDSWR